MGRGAFLPKRCPASGSLPQNARAVRRRAYGRRARLPADSGGGESGGKRQDAPALPLGRLSHQHRRRGAARGCHDVRHHGHAGGLGGLQKPARLRLSRAHGRCRERLPGASGELCSRMCRRFREFERRCPYAGACSARASGRTSPAWRPGSRHALHGFHAHRGLFRDQRGSGQCSRELLGVAH